jgi:RNA polymerase sigma-70 factor (ECF subfamily)
MPLIGGLALSKCPPESEHITALLRELRRGNRDVEEALFSAVYADLRVRAKRYMAGERGAHTLQPTALVHEAYVRIFAGAPVDWQNRTHFFAIAARQMRRVLIDHGREQRAAKRGFGLKVALDERTLAAAGSQLEYEALESLLERLQKTDPESCRVVELKFFSDMTDQEVADVLEVSHSTVRRHWKFARAWLQERLAAAPGPIRVPV